MIEAEKNCLVQPDCSKLERYKRLVATFIQISRLSAVAEKESEFLQKTVNCLVENNGYFNAWIAAFPNYAEQKISAFAWARNDKNQKALSDFFENFEKRILPDCYFEAQESVDKFSVRHPEKDCLECPLAGFYNGCSGFCQILGVKDKVLGFLVVSVPAEISADEEEKKFFQDIADEISLALMRLKRGLELQDAVKRYGAILEERQDGFLVIDKDLCVKETNESLCRILGYERKDLVGRYLGDLTPEKVFLREKSEIFERRTNILGFSGLYEKELTNHEGKSVPFEVLTQCVFNESGEVCYYWQTLRDMSRQKRSNEALRKSELRFKQIYEHMVVGVAVVSLDFLIKSANAAYCKMLGYTEEELIGKHLSEITCPEVLEKNLELQKLLALGKIDSFRLKKRFIHKNGKIVHGNLDACLVRDSKGNPEYFLGIVVDISELKDAEQALKESEERFRLLAEVTVEGILLHKNGLAIDLNTSLARMFGFTREELLNRNFMDFVHPDDVAKVRIELAKSVSAPYTIRMKRRNGNYFYAEIEARDYHIAGNKIRATAVRDISERIKSEEILRESESRFQKMLGVVPDMISIHDCEMNILYSNWQGFAQVPPEKRIKNTKCYKTYRDYDEICPDCRARQVLSSKKIFREEAELPNGQVVDLRVIPFLNESGEVEMFMEWVRDITEQKKVEERERKLQEQLVHAQKLESVGRLAGGIAHDFNNMLSVILGQAEIALLDLENEHPLRSTLEEILKAGQRSADLTRQLLAFARKQTIIPKIFELNEAVDGTLKMLRRLIGEDIELVWKPAAVACMIKMDPTQLDQILANLCVNARDAISGKGKIVIQADIAEIDQVYLEDHPEILPGRYCTLMVSDDGLGMSKETIENIFDPFFTTKDSGAGTGLGLATVYGIVKQNFGFINVYSEPGFGSCFKIFLPMSSASEESMEKAEPDFDLQIGTEKAVLVVEDEVTILAIAVSMLKRLGYRSFSASNAAEALAIITEREIDVLLTDVIMPNNQGPEVAERLRKIKPGLKVIFMSGYTADAIARHGLVEKDVNFLQKPFSLKDLAEALNKAFEAK